MKKIGLILVFAVSTTLATQAQVQEVKRDNWPYWSLSKDVQRMQFKNVRFEPVQIRTGNNDWAISKGAQRAQQAPAAPKGNVTMSGYPTWTISKGAARWRAENKK